MAYDNNMVSSGYFTREHKLVINTSTKHPTSHFHVGGVLISARTPPTRHAAKTEAHVVLGVGVKYRYLDKQG